MMKRYRRFRRGEEGAPILFFVGAFTLATIALVGAFVIFNGRKNNAKAPSLDKKEAEEVSSSEPATEYAPLLRNAPSERVYQEKLTVAVGAFLQETRSALGGWVDAPDFEARTQDKEVTRGISHAAETARAALLEMVVPATLRSRHLVITVAIDDILQMLRTDSAERIDALLLKIEELIKQP